MALDVGAGGPREGISGPPAQLGAAGPGPDGPTADARGRVVRYFAALVLSLYGDWLTTVALVVVLFELTHNPAAPAGYVLVRVAPRLLGPWLGGGLADRYSPRRIMVTTSTVQAIFTALLITSNRAGALWAIYAAVALAQFAGALSRPSQGAMLPSLVSDRALARANSTYWLLFGTSMFVAPAIGALILLHTGPDLLFGIDTATFVISAVLAATLPSGHLSNADAAATGAVHLNAASDLRLGFRDPVIRVVAAANFASGLAVTVTQALLVVAAHERLGGDVAVGYLYSGVGIGATVGGIIALRATPPRPWVRLAVFVVVVAELVFLAGFSAVSALAAALALLALSSLVGSSFDIWGVTEVQRRAPPGYMGRFNAVIWISQYAGLLVGALWALGTATLLHWDVAIQVACAACLVLIGGVWLSGGKSVMAG